MQSRTNTHDFIKIKQGNKNAFDSLFKEYYVSLCRFALQLIDDKDIAEELVQHLFYNIWEKRDRIEIKSSITAYLYRAIRNASINYIKKEKSRQNTQSLFAENNELIENQDEYSEYETELVHAINLAIDNLPEKCRAIFVMSQKEQLKNKEIAQKLNISLKTVENQITIAFKKIREQILPQFKKNLLLFLCLFKK